METSPEIGKIAGALNKFQAIVPSVTKDSTNPYFKSKYATLENVINTITPSLEVNGLSFSQFPDGKSLTTIIMHSSGEWIKASAELLLSKQDPQGQGSAITYMRRYALCGALGLATEEDDDGNAASKPAVSKAPYKVERTIPAADDEAGGAVIQTEEQFAKDEVTDVLKEGIKGLLKQLNKPMTKTVVKAITGLEMIPAHYDAIYKALRVEVEKTDPIETIIQS